MFLIFYTGKVALFGTRQVVSATLTREVPQYITMAPSMEEAKKAIQTCRQFEDDHGWNKDSIGVLKVDPTINYLLSGEDGSIPLDDKYWDYFDSGVPKSKE